MESTLESVDQAEEIVLQEAKAMGFGEDNLHEIGISIRECMVNAVVHGNRYNARKKVHLLVTRTGDKLEILIGDQGEYFNPAEVADPLAEENLLKQSGRGLLMMKAFMDEFEMRPSQPAGTEVRLVKYAPKRV